jgi:hypothetical protein
VVGSSRTGRSVDFSTGSAGRWRASHKAAVCHSLTVDMGLSFPRGFAVALDASRTCIRGTELHLGRRDMSGDLQHEFLRLGPDRVSRRGRMEPPVLKRMPGLKLLVGLQTSVGS